MSSSLKHSVKRRVHLERPSADPSKKPRERKKEFKVRATQLREKEMLRAQLERKAALRNPDEFNFRMKSLKLVNGMLEERDASRPLSAQETHIVERVSSNQETRDRRLAEIQREASALEHANAAETHIFFAEADSSDIDEDATCVGNDLDSPIDWEQINFPLSDDDQSP